MQRRERKSKELGQIWRETLASLLPVKDLCSIVENYCQKIKFSGDSKRFIKVNEHIEFGAIYSEPQLCLCFVDNEHLFLYCASGTETEPERCWRLPGNRAYFLRNLLVVRNRLFQKIEDDKGSRIICYVLDKKHEVKWQWSNPIRLETLLSLSVSGDKLYQLAKRIVSVFNVENGELVFQFPLPLNSPFWFWVIDSTQILLFREDGVYVFLYPSGFENYAKSPPVRRKISIYSPDTVIDFGYFGDEIFLLYGRRVRVYNWLSGSFLYSWELTTDKSQETFGRNFVIDQHRMVVFCDQTILIYDGEFQTDFTIG